jgi:hypothetical protein
MVAPYEVSEHPKLRELFGLYSSYYPPAEDALTNQFFMIYYDLTTFVVRNLRECSPGEIAGCLARPKRYEGYFYSFITDSHGDSEAAYYLVSVKKGGVKGTEMKVK